jgi:hypothetical protein
MVLLLQVGEVVDEELRNCGVPGDGVPLGPVEKLDWDPHVEALTPGTRQAGHIR